MISRRLFRSPSLTYVALAAFLLQASISILAISKNPHTPFDEAAHFDYVVKLSKGHLPKVNEKYGQTVLEDIACQPVRGEAWLGLEPCGTDYYSPRKAPFAGQSSATGYPPNYYLVTAIPYEICDRASTLKPIECGRLANSLWLSVASALLAVLMVVIGASSLMAVVVAVGFGSLPAVLLQGITVNSDAAAQALAPALALAAIYLAKSRFSTRRKWSTWSLLLFLAIPTKPTIIPVAVIVTYLLWDWITERENSQIRNRSGWYAISSLATGVILATLWQSLQVPWRGIGGKDAMTPFLLQSFESLIVSLQTSIGASLSPFTMLTWPPLTDSKLVTISVVVSLLCWVSLFAQRKETDGIPRSSSGLKFSSEFSVIGFSMAVIGPLVLASYAWLSYGSAPVQHRYYMATAVLLGAIGIASTSSKWLKALVASILGLTSAMTVFFLVISGVS